jgi:hypothetical protein
MLIYIAEIVNHIVFPILRVKMRFRFSGKNITFILHVRLWRINPV